MKRLEQPEIQQHLAGLSGWTFTDNAIEKTFELDSFPAAIEFVNRVAGLAEAADHHPDIRIEYRKVTLTLSTHSAGGLTKRDFDLARQIG